MRPQWNEPGPCDWIPIEPWNLWRLRKDQKKYDNRCGAPGLFRVEQIFRGVDSDDPDEYKLDGVSDDHLALCGEHLEACLMLFGPQIIKHWGEGFNRHVLQLRGKQSL